MQYRCKCNNLGSPTCIHKYCRNCCDGINCWSHSYKTRECKCKNRFFNTFCVDRKCDMCCKNVKCDEHYKLCKCKKKVIKKDLCNTNSCSGKCCTDSHCTYHFSTGHEMVDKDFMYCKVALGSKRVLPTELINVIVDEYLDNRLKCAVCKYKFLDIEADIDYGFARVCFICNEWVCENCSSTSLVYGTIETFCDFCEYEGSESEPDYDSSEDDVEVI